MISLEYSRKLDELLAKKPVSPYETELNSLLTGNKTTTPAVVEPPPELDFGVPLDKFHSDLDEIKDLPLKDIKGAIEHPDYGITDKKTAWQKAVEFLGGVQETVEKIPGVKDFGEGFRMTPEEFGKKELTSPAMAAGAFAMASPGGQIPKAGVKIVKTAVQKGEQIFKGFKDLSTTILKSLEGKPSVSKQFIEDLTNQGGIRQAERDMFRAELPAFTDAKGNVDVLDLAQHIHDKRLLPLKRIGGKARMSSLYGESGYEGTTLPNELRGPVANYSEHVYESPIKTSAGSVHPGLPQSEGYFAHTRIEEMAPNYMPGKKVERTIELQSDLFQKGRLESENIPARYIDPTTGKPTKPKEFSAREAELSKLEPYRNTWHERIIREDIKSAAQRGMDIKLYPTGETAMKIEGLGDNVQWRNVLEEGTAHYDSPLLKIEDLKVGKEVSQGMYGSDKWVITDVLGDGKFKAVPKKQIDDWRTLNLDTPMSGGKRLRDYPKEEQLKIQKAQLESFIETFDISGKVDPNNPIYKFYEKEIGRFLQNKFGGEQITDPQGVKWWEVYVPKEAKNQAVQAYGGIKTNVAIVTGSTIGFALLAPLIEKGIKSGVGEIKDWIEKKDVERSIMTSPDLDDLRQIEDIVNQEEEGWEKNWVGELINKRRSELETKQLEDFQAKQ